MIVGNLRCNYKEEPIGISTKKPLLQWLNCSEAYGSSQSEYEIQVASSADRIDAPDAWDSGWIKSSMNSAEYQGKEIEAGADAFWRVRTKDEKGEVSPWSGISFWRQGLREDQWSGEWIGFDEGRENYDPSIPYYCADNFDKGDNQLFLPKPAMMRKEFTLEEEPAAATLYVSAYGLADLSINDKRAVSGHLIPGLCDYTKRVYYFAYDVGSLLHAGNNALAAVLADGWYAGYIGLNPRHWWGSKPRLSCELHITFRNGRKTVIRSNSTWKALTGPWLYADIMHGTGYDSRLEPTGWKNADFDDSGWKAVSCGAEYPHVPTEHPGVRIVEHARYAPGSIERINSNEAIIDFGRCFAGVVSLKVRGPRGSQIDLYHAEEFDRAKGDLYYFGNRSAQAHDCYILSGEGTEEFQPEFTYHGFRYVHVYGLQDVELISAEGVAVSSDLPDKTVFEIENPVVREAMQLILNTQQCNMMDMPTDVCARDERLGWGTEGNLFMHTACALNNNALFLRKWMKDAVDSADESGCMWANAPAVKMIDVVPFNGDVHSDIAVHCAWLLCRNYGDYEPVKEILPALETYFDYNVRNSDRLLRFATSRDWLDIGRNGRTDTDHGYGSCDPCLLGTIWFAGKARMMEDITRSLGFEQKSVYYHEMYRKIREAFRRYFLGRNKKLRDCTQGGYALAAVFGLIEGDELDVAAKWISDDMEAHKGVTWGTATAPFALFGMDKLGLRKEAVEFVLSREYPSLGYMARSGATTIWERWDSIFEGAFFPHPMNAFSHIGYASIGEWIISRIGGIAPEDDGFSKVLLRPVLCRELGNTRTEYSSVRGTITAELKYDNGASVFRVILPAGVSGKLVLDKNVNDIHITAGKDWVSFGLLADSRTELNLESGKYEFIINNI